MGSAHMSSVHEPMPLPYCFPPLLGAKTYVLLREARDRDEQTRSIFAILESGWTIE